MIHAGFASLLQQEMGLDAASIGPSAVERAVETRLSACKSNDVDAYWEHVRTCATELQALIEAVIVPETWFFRDREAFWALAHVANEDWLPASPEGTLRLLSLPCSSGEEPYSMAIALLDTRFPASRCRIDAVDISAQVLDHAQRGIYGKNSFRGPESAFRDRHFETTALGYRLSDTVRQYVHFQQGNLLASDFLPGVAIYDIVFCRNLLIYFDRATQDRAVEVLRRLLKPNGVLFVGPSESNLFLDHGFVSIKVPLAFAFRQSDSVQHATDTATAPARTQPEIASPSTPPKSSPTNRAKLVVSSRSSTPAKPTAPSGAAQYDAFRLADQGRLTEASKSCEEYLRQHGPSAHIFYLIGLMRAAAGDLVQGGQYYRKALYLEPNHRDTLLHLGLLLEKQGDDAGAQLIRARLQRLQQKSGVT